MEMPAVWRREGVAAIRRPELQIWWRAPNEGRMAAGVDMMMTVATECWLGGQLGGRVPFQRGTRAAGRCRSVMVCPRRRAQKFGWSKLELAVSSFLPDNPSPPCSDDCTR